MPRPPRIDFSGAIHHVTSRGNRRKEVFRCDGDRWLFLATLAEVCRFHGWSCLAYCLMNNHYHLVVITNRATLSAGMKQLNGNFTQVFNRRHSTVGHVFQGRFKSSLVRCDAHLLAACRYVVLNPVRAGMVASPSDWQWSSFRATVGDIATPKFLDAGAVRKMFSSDDARAMALYRRFVADGVGLASPFKSIDAGGSGTAQNTEKTSAVPRLFANEPSVVAARPSLAEIFSGAVRGESRWRAVLLARQTHGYGIQEIANHLGIHYSTVSKLIKRLNETKS